MQEAGELEREAAESGVASHKLIFLDIDGVLNGRGQLHIDLKLATRLLSLVRSTGAEIVLSSMWRLKSLHRRQVRAACLAVGLPRPLSYTPCMHHGHDRAAEIMAWLRLNTENVLQHQAIEFPPVQLSSGFTERHYELPVKIRCSHFCVLDDLDLTDPGRGDPQQLLRDHFVRTPARYGLTDHNVSQALAVLTRATPAPVELLIATHCESCSREGPQYSQRTWNKFFCDSRCAGRFVL